MTWLKKCEADGCDHEFPEHYFHDRCSDHRTPEDDARARERAGVRVPSGQHLINVVANLAGQRPPFLDET